jgi:hypothetical protein
MKIPVIFAAPSEVGLDEMTVLRRQTVQHLNRTRGCLCRVERYDGRPALCEFVVGRN